MPSENERYDAVAAQPMEVGMDIVNLGRAMLYAEVFARNEATKMRADEARAGIVQALE